MKNLFLCTFILFLASLPCCRTDVPSKNAFNFGNPGFQPNILWITCEDITPALGCYGDTSGISPNLDRLAGEGLRYTRAFSVAGVCAPSRHALITGMYPTSTGEPITCVPFTTPAPISRITR